MKFISTAQCRRSKFWYCTIPLCTENFPKLFTLGKESEKKAAIFVEIKGPSIWKLFSYSLLWLDCFLFNYNFISCFQKCSTKTARELGGVKN